MQSVLLLLVLFVLVVVELRVSCPRILQVLLVLTTPPILQLKSNAKKYTAAILLSTVNLVLTTPLTLPLRSNTHYKINCCNLTASRVWRWGQSVKGWPGGFKRGRKGKPKMSTKSSFFVLIASAHPVACKRMDRSTNNKSKVWQYVTQAQNTYVLPRVAIDVD